MLSSVVFLPDFNGFPSTVQTTVGGGSPMMSTSNLMEDPADRVKSRKFFRSIFGARKRALAVTGADDSDGSESPALFFATTLNVYCCPGVTALIVALHSGPIVSSTGSQSGLCLSLFSKI